MATTADERDATWWRLRGAGHALEVEAATAALANDSRWLDQGGIEATSCSSSLEETITSVRRHREAPRPHLPAAPRASSAAACQRRRRSRTPGSSTTTPRATTSASGTGHTPRDVEWTKSTYSPKTPSTVYRLGTMATRELLNVRDTARALGCTRTRSATGRPAASSAQYSFPAAASGVSSSRTSSGYAPRCSRSSDPQPPARS